jgi:prophage DNA circulation protein
MASWRDRMGAAKFRGVPFYVETAERSGGRRTVVHEYPFKEDPYVEDMGRAPRRFTIEAYVIGPQYMDARDRLLTELEKAGAGELFHPYYKTIRVTLDGDYRVRESRDNGGMAVFSIPFIETPAKAAQPTAIQDAPAKVQASGAVALASVGAEFLRKYQPGTLLASVTGALRAATLSMENVLATSTMTTQALASLRGRVERFASTVETLAESPEDLLETVLDVLGDFESIAALLDFYAFDPGLSPPATTANRVIEATNFEAVQLVHQRVAVVQAAMLAPFQTFDSYEAALATRTAITDLLDEQSEVVSDDVYPSLLQLRADLVGAVPGDSADLARLVDCTPPLTLPSLVLAQQRRESLFRDWWGRAEGSVPWIRSDCG